MKTRKLSLSSLVPDQRNARLHNERNLEAIRASLVAHGQVQPLVVQAGSLRVLAGNARLQVMLEMGMDKATCTVVEVDDAQADRIAVALNRTAELAEWDKEMLEELLRGSTEAELQSAGFNQEEFAFLCGPGNPLADKPEAAPEEPPEVPVAQRGDIWLLGRHRLMCGDSTDPSCVTLLLNGEEPGLMVTDPPYGVDYDPEWRIRAGFNSAEGATAKGKVSNDDQDSWTRAWALFPGAVAYVWHAGLSGGQVHSDLHAAGFVVRGQIIWRKPRGIFSRCHYHWAHEPCWYAVRRGAKASWIGDRKQSTVWEIPVTKDGDRTGHSTQKPIECMARPIRHHSSDGVYEPFCGSGSTLIACEELGRTCFAMELDPGYVDVIVRRWEKATGVKASLAVDGRTFDEVAQERLQGEVASRTFEG